MNYRPATTSDASALIGLMSELGYAHTKESIAANLQRVEDRGGSVFVAMQEGLIVGCVCAIIDVRLAAGECGEIVSLVVSGEHRKKGVGKGLIKHAEDWLGHHTHSIRVRADVKRGDAHEFYKGLGYEEEKSQKLFRKVV
ncbi:GNAT family N-acetyltransferase [Allohahella marinimesophila]|uniref:N-acetyltransferase domain-containing protein n=1 Tax=Allohahella marinimesophila TaxID=1054972 RepID=A0ABP7PAD2_9GAMM